MIYSYANHQEEGCVVFAHLDRHHCLYYKSPWTHSRTMDEFCRELSRHFGLSDYMSGLLRQLLEEDNVAEWLEEKGFNPQLLTAYFQPTRTFEKEIDRLAETFGVATTLSSNNGDLDDEIPASDVETSFDYLPPTPDVHKNQLQEKRTVPTSPFFHRTKVVNYKDYSPDYQVNQVNMTEVSMTRAILPLPKSVLEEPEPSIELTPSSLSGPSISYNTSPRKEKSLLNLATEKTELSGDAKKAIGEWGEQLVFEKLRQHYQTKYSQCDFKEIPEGFKLTGTNKQGKPLNLEVIWHNKLRESYKPKDFTIIRNGRERVIEVKSTTALDATLCTISSNEANLMHHYKERYRFFRVYGVGTNKPNIAKLKNPSEKLKNNELSIISLEIKM